MTGLINSGKKFKSDILKMMINGTSNDVKIVLEDGEILANKDVLCARSEYFATMLSNSSSNKEVKFIEGETKTVDMVYCSKIIMEKIIKYMFSGDMVLNDLSFGNLLKMMNMTSMMMLVDIHVNVKDYVLDLIPEYNIPDLVDGLVLAEGFNLQIVKKSIVKDLYSNLSFIPVQNFKMLPINLVKDILLPLDEDDNEDKDLDKDKDEDDEDEDDDDEDDDEENLGDDEENEEDDEVSADDTDDADRFSAFVFWLSGNDCSDEDKKEIKDSIDLKKSCFTADKLLTDVRQSGLFSIKEVDDRLLDIIRKKE